MAPACERWALNISELVVRSKAEHPHHPESPRLTERGLFAALWFHPRQADLSPHGLVGQRHGSLHLVSRNRELKHASRELACPARIAAARAGEEVVWRSGLFLVGSSGQDSLDFSVNFLRGFYGVLDSSALGVNVGGVNLICQKNGRGESNEGFDICCHLRDLHLQV